MITDIASYLKFFDSVRRRTERDVAALPPEAAAWRPPAIAGESEWSIGQIINHLGGSRLYFASAYRGEGWLWTRTDEVMDPDDPKTWLPWLRTSAERFAAQLADTPAEWLNRYVSRGYVLKDSIILHAKSNGAPFFWDELDPIVEADPQARLIMGEAREFNLVGGFTAAIPTLDGQTIGFSIGGRHFEIDPEKRGVLTLIACCAVGRAIALQQESSTKSKNVTLSPREREALQWAAEGKGDWEIGEVMNISEHGADKHLRSIRTKLGAINRTQAVAEAIRLGLIA